MGGLLYGDYFTCGDPAAAPAVGTVRFYYAGISSIDNFPRPGPPAYPTCAGMPSLPAPNVDYPGIQDCYHWDGVFAPAALAAGFCP